jgi:hypothetical protein
MPLAGAFTLKKLKAEGIKIMSTLALERGTQV